MSCIDGVILFGSKAWGPFNSAAAQPLVMSPPRMNFLSSKTYLLHPEPRSSADKKVEAKPMAEKWHPDFERLVDEHQSMVFSLAWRMTGDRGLAEEVAQDVFLELDRHMDRIESPEHAMFWLRRVAMNRSADALRRRKVRGVDLWVEIEENHGAPAEERSSPLSARLEHLLGRCRRRSGRPWCCGTRKI